MFLKQTNVFCVKHFFNYAVFVVCLRLTVLVCCFLMLFGTITFIQLFNNLVPLAICSVSQMPQVNTLALLSFVVLIVLCWSCFGAVYFGWQHSCCCCFCPVRKAFVVVVVKLALPINAIIVTVAVFFISVKSSCFVPEADTSTVFLLPLSLFIFICLWR